MINAAQKKHNKSLLLTAISVCTYRRQTEHNRKWDAADLTKCGDRKLIFIT